MMIGYSAGFMMLWDSSSKSLLNILKSTVNLHHLHWRSEDEFYSSHSDGHFTLWDVETGAQIQVRRFSYQLSLYFQQAPHTPYGPYPCKSINKFYCKETEELKWIVFR